MPPALKFVNLPADALRIRRQHDLVEAGQLTLALLHQLRLEAAVTVPRAR